MTFFGETVTKVYQNVNGNLSFNAAFSKYTPDTIPFTNTAVVSAYLQDLDTDNGGCDRNRLYARVTTDANDLASASAIVNGNDDGTNGTPFQATAAFVSTWYNVEQYGGNTESTVTFQATLAYNNDVTWVILSYDLLEFFSSSSSSETFIGFNGLNDQGFMMDQISSSAEATELIQGSNCGTPGTYVFTVSEIASQTQTPSQESFNVPSPEPSNGIRRNLQSFQAKNQTPSLYNRQGLRKRHV